MTIKNYTSQVAAARSISYIERKLVQHGATYINKEYEKDGRIKSMSFSLKRNGAFIPFRLPAKTEACEKVLIQNLSKRARPETLKKIPEQAERTAWKILSDWVEIQMSMIELAQVDFMEVFMPYVFDPIREQTFFEKMKEKNFKALLPEGVNNG